MLARVAFRNVGKLLQDKAAQYVKDNPAVQTNNEAVTSSPASRLKGFSLDLISLRVEVQTLQRRMDEHAVLAHQHIIEIDACFGISFPLYLHQVPMDC